jgi:uncharacterized protein
MGLLMFIYTICATRTNAVYVVIFTSLILVFCLLAAAYWRLAQADVVVGNRLAVVSPPVFRLRLLCEWASVNNHQGAGAALFLASMLGFYLLTVQLLASVGFPLSLPIGDLSGLWDRRKEQ